MNSKGGILVAGLAAMGSLAIPTGEMAFAGQADAPHVSITEMPMALDPANPCVLTAETGDSPYSIIHEPGVSISQKTFAKVNGFADFASAVILAGNKYDVCPNNNDDIKHPLAGSTPEVTVPAASPVEAPATVVNSKENCPTKVTNMGNVSAACISLAHTTLTGYGFVDSGDKRDIKAFQILDGITVRGGVGYGNMGPTTYSEIMGGKGIETITTNANAILHEGIIVDKSDQTLLQLDNGVVVSADLISTGKSTPEENRETREGTFKVDRKKDGWIRSTLQAIGADPAMYRPRYFSNGQAIHGTPASQLWKLGTEASHGCVRTYEKFQNWLIEHGLKNGTKVVVKP